MGGGGKLGGGNRDTHRRSAYNRARSESDLFAEAVQEVILTPPPWDCRKKPTTGLIAALDLDFHNTKKDRRIKRLRLVAYHHVPDARLKPLAPSAADAEGKRACQ